MLTPVEYRMIVEQTPLMIWRSNTRAECDYFNERWLAFTGRTLDEEMGDGWAKGVHPDDYERCMNTHMNAFKLRYPFEMEYRLRRFDGVYRWVFAAGAPIEDAGGTFLGYTGSCIDVNDRVEARVALARETLKNLGLLS